MSSSPPSHECSKCLVLRVTGLDCAEEVALLRRALGPAVRVEEELSFDLMRGTLTLHRPPTERDDPAILALVKTTGLRAERWNEATHAKPTNGRWAEPRLVWLASLSGSGLVLGYGVHTVSSGALSALTGATEPPLIAAALFVLGVLVALVHIGPKALISLRFARPDMHLLMAIAIAGALALGEYAEGATVAFLFLVSLLMESWNIERARRSVASLMELTPATARVVCPHDGDLMDRPVETVSIGAKVIVRPGERVPLDGDVLVGESLVDQSPMTGESVPVPRGVGDALLAGTINQTGELTMVVSRVAKDSMIARMLRLIEEARSRRAPAEQWVDSFARYYTPAMMLLAFLVAVVPPLLMGAAWDASIYRALVVLVIACPCALVVSTPVAITAALSSAARNGVLIKGGLYLEQMAGIRGIAFDKTGTLTVGKPEVAGVYPAAGTTEGDLLNVAAALEQGSNHPLAQAILRHAESQGIRTEAAAGHRAVHGFGVSGEVNGATCWAGSPDYAARWTSNALTPNDTQGCTLSLVGRGDQLLGAIALRDAPRAESRTVLAQLSSSGISELRMLTGDNPDAAQRVAQDMGLNHVDAGLNPEEKVRAVEAMVQRLGSVAMVGDGVNDAPALAAATVGIAMGAAGTDAALETADIALMNDDLTRLPWLLHHARATRAIIFQNIAFALGTKALFLGLAALGMAGLWAAIAADMGASLLVIFNALRLLRTTTPTADK